MFTKSSLEALGMKIQIGHSGPGKCKNLSPVGRRVVVCDSTGIYTHRVRFCKCLDEHGSDTDEWRQLMRLGWFPATMERPETVFTFRLLKTFQELNFQGKTNLHDYWKSIENITDNSGGQDVPVSPTPFNVPKPSNPIRLTDVRT